MTFDKKGFLEWLEQDVDGYYVSPDRVREEWPEFYDNYKLVGVTSKYDAETNTVQTPVRDYRQAVVYGQPLD